MCGEKFPNGKVIAEETGITPACAGKSICYYFQNIFTRDHPRMCGEKMSRTNFCASSLGSPPHVRGKVIIGKMNDEGARITPACAGKRIHGSMFVHYVKDHPRMCGEKKGMIKMLNADEGSPPHVRGKADNCNRHCYQNGITPACAGKRHS